jgi:hypothetical protein
MNRTFENKWDRIIFIASIIGLAFLMAISIFRYYYLIPEQQSHTKNYHYIQHLKNENRELKAEIDHLKQKLDDDQK